MTAFVAVAPLLRHIWYATIGVDRLTVKCIAGCEIDVLVIDPVVEGLFVVMSHCSIMAGLSFQESAVDCSTRILPFEIDWKLSNGHDPSDNMHRSANQDCRILHPY